MKRTASVLVIAVLALAACNDKASDNSGDGRTAEGEVRGGTISDAMLPLDTVKSQSPPLRTEPTEGATEAADEQPASETAEEPAAEATSAPQPAPQPGAATPAAGEGDGQ
jgi:hypothetical protein